MELLNQLCTQILAEAKIANPFEIKFWKEEMKEDIDTMLSEIQKKVYTGLDVIFGEIENVFREEKEEEVQEEKEIEQVD